MKFYIFVAITISSIGYFIYKSALIYLSSESTSPSTLDIVQKNKCVKSFDPITNGISATLIIEEMNLLITRNWYGEILGYNLKTLKLEKNYSGPIHKFHRFANLARVPNKNQIIYDDFTFKKDNITLVILDLESGKNLTAFKTEMNSFSVQKIVMSPHNPELAVVLTGKTYDVFVYNITSQKLVNWAWTLMNPMIQRYYQIFDMVYLEDGNYLSLNQLINKYDYDTKKYEKENELVYFAVWNFSEPPNKNIIKKVSQARAYQQMLTVPQNPNKIFVRTFNKTSNTTTGGIFDYSTLEFVEFDTKTDYTNCDILNKKDKITVACSSGDVKTLSNLQITEINVSEDGKTLDGQISLHTGDHYIVDIRSLSYNPNKLLVVVMTDNMFTLKGVNENRMSILEWDIQCQKKYGEVKIEQNTEL